MPRKIYIAVIILLSAAILVFTYKTRQSKPVLSATPVIPSIGSLQILNGSGKPGAGQVVAEFLRKKGFDVKEISNASDWNYRRTIVVSRTRDMEIASMVADSLRTASLIRLRRSSNSIYDVTVFVGADWRAIVNEDFDE